MVKDQGTKSRKKKFTKKYYLLLVPAIVVGLMVIPWITSANQTAIDIVSFPDFVLDEDSVIDDGMEPSADNYLPLATTEVDSGQEAETLLLPETVMAEILTETQGEEGETGFATEVVDIAVTWDETELDLAKPGLYKLDMVLPGDYSYKGVLPFVTVEVKEAADSEDDQEVLETKSFMDDDAQGTDAPTTETPATDTPEEDAPETDAPVTDAPATDAPEADAPTTAAPTEEPTPEATGGEDEPVDEKQAVACNHEEGCTVTCDDENDCKHVCDETCVVQQSKEIVQFCGLYPNGKVMLSSRTPVGGENIYSGWNTVSAYMTDGSEAQIPVKWVGNYDTNTPGTYMLRMEVEDGYIWNGPDMLGEIIVYNNESGR